MDSRRWTISNVLSFSRIILTIPIILLLLRSDIVDRWWALGLMVVASLTDFFDGMLARTYHQETDLGKILDPLADKIAVVTITGLLTFKGIIPLWFLIAAVIRDGLILTGGLYVKARKKIVLQSNVLGKWTVTIMALYIMLATLSLQVMHVVQQTLLMMSTVMMILSFATYARRFVFLLKKEL